MEPGRGEHTMITQDTRLLVVEDDADIAALLRLHLEDTGAKVVVCGRGDEAVEQIAESQWSAVLLDLRLPGVNGLDICRGMREAGDRTPVLMLTSKSGELDRVLGLELGADDYLTKPFSALELVARVRALLRRSSVPAQLSPKELRCGAVAVSPRDRSVIVDDRAVDLTSREFDLLVHFLRHPGQVFRRSELLDQVWGYGHEGYEHTVNSHINRLRNKIEHDPAEPRYIHTVWGVGYKFADPGAAP